MVDLYIIGHGMSREKNSGSKFSRLRVALTLKAILRRIFQVRGYKTFFMLNSAEHEIFFANNNENASKSWHFHIY